MVGTSLFTNYMKDEVKNCFDDYDDINKTYKDIIERPAKEYESLRYPIEHIESIIKEQWLKNITKKENNSKLDWEKEENILNLDVSAELTSLIRIIKEIGDKNNEGIEVYLLTSDTVASRLAAHIIAEHFNNIVRLQFTSANIKALFEPAKDIISHLQVYNQRDFEKEGLPNLIHRIEDIREGYSPNVILNITGGYKATIPYLTILGQVYNIPIYYTFEDTHGLIKIPQAPLDINWGMFEKYAPVIEELSNGVEVDWNDYRRSKGIGEDFDACIWHDEGLVLLNAIGELFYKRYLEWTLVYVLIGRFSSDEAHRNRQAIKNAIIDTVSKLESFFQDSAFKEADEGMVKKALRERRDDVLNHEKLPRGGFIAKCTGNKPEVRLLYDFNWKSGNLVKIRFYDFRVGEFDHGSYIKEFEQFYSNIHSDNRDGKFVPYLQAKLI